VAGKIPRVNRSEPTVHRRTLGRAIEIAGGDEKLALFLGVPLAELKRWHAGEADLPAKMFLALVDIVSSNALAPAALRNLR
jgi:DNA-binding transcriptional regulator YdaS (Cro superfamily)